MARKKVMAPHWADDVSQCDIGELHDIKTSIEKNLVNAATAFIEIGHSLNRARVLIPGDLEFGQWREQHTPFTAKQAGNYMKVARKFSAHSLVAKTSLTVLVELSSAPPELTKDVESAIDSGKDVKKADVQAAKREGKSVDEVLEERRTKERNKADKKIAEDKAKEEYYEKVDAAAEKARAESKDANNLPPLSRQKQASVSKSMASEPPLVDGRTGEVISRTPKEAKDALPLPVADPVNKDIAKLIDSPTPEEDSLPPGDYEMLAVTEDEFDLVIAALEFYAADGNDDAMKLAERLNR